MKEGMRRARRMRANGKTVTRYGSRQMKVYMARNERVCDHCLQDRSRITRFWKTKTTPIRELKRRKLADIVVILKEGFSTTPGEEDMGSRFEERSSVGMTCWRSLDCN
jgi:hypothetical protein